MSWRNGSPDLYAGMQNAMPSFETEQLRLNSELLKRIDTLEKQVAELAKLCGAKWIPATVVPAHYEESDD